MQTCSRHCDSALIFGENALEVAEVVLCSVMILAAVNNITWQRSLTESIKLTFELVVRTVVEETQRTSAAGGIVDYFGHHSAAVVEEQLVADTYLACRLYQHIPQAHLFVELAQQEHFYLCVSLLLRTVQARREYFCVIEYESIVLVEIVEHVAEVKIITFYRITLGILLKHIDGLRFTMNDHQFALVASCHTKLLCLSFGVCKLTHNAMRIECDLFFR